MWTGLCNATKRCPLTLSGSGNVELLTSGRRSVSQLQTAGHTQTLTAALTTRMASLRALLSLAVCLLLGQQTLAKNAAPCQRTKWNNAFSTFVKRHIRSGTPSSLDHNEWERYIRNHGGCDRPTQSFLHPSDLDRVKAVCTNQGGKTYQENLCISREPFTFVTVRSEPGTCGIRSIREENKHLILACELLENQCLPVHFEGNSQNLKPDNNAKACQDPEKASAPSFKMTWLWLLSVLVLLIYGH